MSDHFIEIYTRRAADYERFISVEDVEGNLLKALERFTPLAGKRVLDLGTGTGRLPRLLAGRAARPSGSGTRVPGINGRFAPGRAALTLGIDLHWDMLRQNASQRAAGGGRWWLSQGDMRQLPIRPGAFDLVTAGWAIGHLCGWYADDWRTHVGRALQEMHRAAVSPGSLVIFETLTTGSLTPAPPTQALARYYAWLEDEWGFEPQVLSTDYQFADVEQAVAWTEFFFGPDLAHKIRANGWARLPEWTGMWTKRV